MSQISYTSCLTVPRGGPFRESKPSLAVVYSRPQHLLEGVDVTDTAAMELLSSIGLRTVSPPLREGPFPSVVPRDNSVFGELVALLRPSLLIEFGSWEGASALAWCVAADEAEMADSPPLILCVDTWLGSVEHWMNDYPDSEWSRERLNVVAGNPQVFDTFKNSVSVCGYEERVLPFRTTTLVAAAALDRLEVRAQLIYVDAGHDTDSVLRDLRVADQLVTDEGVIVGDDWGWRTVRLAVYRFLIPERRCLYTKNGQFLVSPRHVDRMKMKYLDDSSNGWKRIGFWGAAMRAIKELSISTRWAFPRKVDARRLARQGGVREGPGSS
jgi:hypothetical protein